MTSLECLAKRSGIADTKLNALAKQHKEDWLAYIKTQIQLEKLP
jgi:hypothetical protein